VEKTLVIFPLTALIVVDIFVKNIGFLKTTGVLWKDPLKRGPREILNQSLQ
jgi:hypothetical protein